MRLCVDDLQQLFPVQPPIGHLGGIGFLRLLHGLRPLLRPLLQLWGPAMGPDPILFLFCFGSVISYGV